MTNPTQKVNKELEEKMSFKNYAKFDRTFMAFGSIMNGLQGYLAITESTQINETINSAWEQAKELVNSLVEEMYDNGEESAL